ncbi:hypothetical protein G9G53_22700 [Paenibacillus sp. EKM206P]|uniref:hypothetical protein n=1 Tax=Paenibacillus sp. EKM206P TaxID=1683674 RepID=UPI0013EA92C7|nr:hypothetical protein [Paenibacillus sp. EKM206P]KAF6569101.1 hypothetical protein G9G53_22700 [Paenibacillus sp. EKM206P]
MPSERKLWLLRKYAYGGVPPTDPRILAMTDEQIELEFAHLDLDRKARDGKGEDYDDPEFDEWENETEEADSKLSYDYTAPKTPAEELDDWEDVE